MSSVEYEIAVPDGRKFTVQVTTAPKARAAVFAGDRETAELVGYVRANCIRYEARDLRGASLGFYTTTLDAVGAVARLLEWKPSI